MPRYNYIVKDDEANTQKGIVEASSISHASDLLHSKGFVIIDLKEATEGLFPKRLHRQKISTEDIVHFTRQLSTMITAGLTLVESLAILKRQVSKASTLRLVSKIENEVEAGKSFSETLKNFPSFPPVYHALVKAGEASGKLDVILTRLAENLEKSRKLRSRTRGALIYPSIVVIGMIIVTIVVLTVVIPRLTHLYKEFGAALPLATQILIGISNFFLNYWSLLLITFISSLVFFVKWRKTIVGKHVLATVSLNIPIFGNLIKQSTLVEMTRTLSILIDSGVPILISLDIVQNVTGNVLYQEAFKQASKMVEKGFPMSDAFINNKLFPPILAQMISVGEKTGKLGDSLFKLSIYFETETNNLIRNLTTLIEPFIMIVLGLGVGFLVLAVLLPIYSLTSKF